MPVPIQPIRNYPTQPTEGQQDITTLIPMVQPFQITELFESLFENRNSQEKSILKRVWLASTKIDNDKIKVSAEIELKDLQTLKSKGLLHGEDGIFEFTEKGSKLLRESILNDEESSFTKQASKQMIANSSYDFGDDILVRVSHPDKFGTRYITMPKKTFRNKTEPQVFESYNIATRKNDGSLKDLSNYTEDELVQILHLAKRIVDNSHDIIISGHKIVHVPVHRIRTFSEMIMKELNSR